MATDTREPPHSPTPTPTVAVGLAEADAKMVATGHGDCQKLKDLVQQQDPATMLVVMASSKQQASPSPKEKSSCASMHPLLAAAACRGHLEELRYLHVPTPEPSDNLSKEFLNQAMAYSCGNCTNAISTDVELGRINNNAAPLLMSGVTVEGDTAIHLVAASGEGQNFLDCVKYIHGLDKALLSKENNKGDTPLHCAARAGKHEMVSLLVTLAEGDGIVKQILRKENKRKETALHEAVRIGDDNMARKLLEADPKLACFPQESTSPLYLAISLGRDKTVKTLHDESENGLLSYSGPDGQNALHAAVLRGPVLTGMVLEWNKNKDLTTEKDKNGRTPLHFAAGLKKASSRQGNAFEQVLEANTAAVYQPDNYGLYPIHVAASVGAVQSIALILKKCGSSVVLRDAKGRTFLHVAVGKRKLGIIRYACRDGSLAWIMNMQDDDGNTALHLAVQAGRLRMFAALFGNRHVDLNLANTKGETPLDIAKYKIPPGPFYDQNPEARIHKTLMIAGAMRGTSGRDHFREKYEQIHGQETEHERRDMDAVKESTQTMCIGSVLIAIVTFGATFALPGGYRADDHTNGGTPTLAGRYAFDAFVMANTLAFILSSMATVFLVRSGTPYLTIRIRQSCSSLAVILMYGSVTCLAVAFALAVYVVLGSVARNTAIAVCVLSLLVVLCNVADTWLITAILARSLFIRLLVRFAHY